LTVDNDCILYQATNPAFKPTRESSTRAETDSGHYVTLYSGVTLPEQHLSSHQSFGQSPRGARETDDGWLRGLIGGGGRGALEASQRKSRGASKGASKEGHRGGSKARWAALKAKSLGGGLGTSQRKTCKTWGESRGASTTVGASNGAKMRGKMDPSLKLAALKDGDLNFVSAHNLEIPRTESERHGRGQDRYLAYRHSSCLAPYAGLRVAIHGIRGPSSELNGLVGDALSLDEMAGRYLVALPDGRKFKLKPCFLCGHSENAEHGPCAVCRLKTSFG